MVLRRNRLARAATQSRELAATFTRLQRVATQLTRLAWATPDPGQEASWRQRVAGLSVAMEQLEAELSAGSAEYRQAKRAIPLEDLRAALSEDSVLVDFVEYEHKLPADKKSADKARSERRLLGFVVVAGRPVEMLPLGPMQPINEAIETWRVTFGMSAEGVRAARLLGERLWVPIEEKLHGAKIVLISPDGGLSRLPFGALPGKMPGSYLLEERTLAVVPVPQLIPQLVQEEGRKQLRKKLLLLGDVDYDALPAKAPDAQRGMVAVSSNENGDVARADVARLLFRSVPPGTLHFGPLPGTGSEIAAIEELYRRQVGFDGVTALKNSQASKEAFLAAARQHGYLHLATHGFFIEEKVHMPALGARETGPLGEMLHELEAGVTYPSLLSGLALAGANQLDKADASETSGGNGGILTAEEIGTQNLDGVQLVVLSACESGLGRLASGEGLLGLQRSFQSAGARTVAASLWPVDDVATKTLMVAFYTNLWKKKLSKLDALRQAQLTMLREYDPKAGRLRGPGTERPVDPGKLAAAKEVGGAKSLSPFYWASFVLSGDWK
jgi:CHAT domain-containing protein